MKRERALKLENFFRIDAKNGVITRKDDGERVFFFSTKAWAFLFKKIHASFDKGADILLFEMGQYYGSSLALEIKHYDLDYEKAVKSLLDTASVAGWGKISVSGDVQTGKGLTVTVRSCAFCADQKGTVTLPSCHFLRGAISGMAQILYDKEYKPQETKCISVGDPHCEFVLEAQTYSIYGESLRS